jgi:hypothetical protein
MRVLKLFLVLCTGFAAAGDSMAGQVAVREEPASIQGPRALTDQSKAAVIRDYLKAWQSFGTALGQNRPELLQADFVGTAQDELMSTVKQQDKLGLRAVYKDRSHDLQIVFYSPDGMSVELTDKVQYDVQVIDHDKAITTQRESARYLVVLAPAEVRWKVRIFQAMPNDATTWDCKPLPQ